MIPRLGLCLLLAVQTIPLLGGQPRLGESLQVGYATMEALNGGNLPIGSALFSLRNSDGILVSEAGISAVEPIRSGRIFVDQAGNSTGLA